MEGSTVDLFKELLGHKYHIDDIMEELHERGFDVEITDDGVDLVVLKETRV